MSTTPEIESDVCVIGAGAAGCAAAFGASAYRRHRGTSRKRRRASGSFLWGIYLRRGRVCALGVGCPRIGGKRSAPPRSRGFGCCRAEADNSSCRWARGGWGLSRRALDGALLDEALARGVRLIEHAGVEDFSGDLERGYRLRLGGGASGSEIRCRAVIGAHGKASQVDRLLGRPFVHRTSRYIGVKCRFEGADLGDRVELYLFQGGYCGVAAIEGGGTNVCLLARREVLSACGGRPMAVIEAVARENKAFAGMVSRHKADRKNVDERRASPFWTKESRGARRFHGG